MIAHEPTYLPAAERSGPGYDAAELTGKRVGMIGFGHVARRLVELLASVPGRDSVPTIHSPHASSPSHSTSPSLRSRRSSSRDVVFVLVPETSTTVGMLGDAELALLRPGSVLVNVSRGANRRCARRCSTAFGRATSSPASTSSTRSRCRSTRRSSTCRTSSALRTSPVSPRRAAGGSSRLMVDECLRHFDGLDLRYELTTEVVARRAELWLRGPEIDCSVPPRTRRRSCSVKNGQCDLHNLE